MWNLYQVLILGWKISGIDYYFSISQFSRQNLPDIISGGVFGLEASLSITILIILNLVVFYKFMKINPEITALLFKRDYGKVN